MFTPSQIGRSHPSILVASGSDRRHGMMSDILAGSVFGRKKKSNDPTVLRTEAAKLVEKGKHADAGDVYGRLEQVDPDPDWARRAAESYRRAGEKKKAIKALARASDGYLKGEFFLKAIAMCKVILTIDPEHKATQARLAELGSRRRMGMSRIRGEAARQMVATRGGLQNASLNEVVQGSKPLESSPDLPKIGVHEIPLEDMDWEEDESEESELSPEEEAQLVARDLLPELPLFSDLGQESLERLIEKLGFVQLDPGEVAFEEGDPAFALYVIAEGQVAIVTAVDGVERELHRLGEGEFFGEIGLVSNQPRTATARAVEETQLLMLVPQAINELIEAEPSVLAVLLRFLRDRLIDRLVKTNQLFTPYSGGERRALAARFKFLEVERDAVLVEQGADAEGLYVLLSGSVRVEREQDEARHRLATLGAGDLFGEISLLSQEPALATVSARDKCFALQLPAKEFRQVIMTHPQILETLDAISTERRERLEAIVAGASGYDEGHLELV